MRTLIAAGLVILGALAGAPAAAADPYDLLPYCSGDQTPMDTNCRPMAHQDFTHDAPGANPNVPTGLTPGSAPAI